ncbi:hypothetical protein B0H66DRAFT_627109 [Apodospora peruviana]|uniref:Uncharacterized protein n=1 Tax=Apodospora peruviana TaxID=516989 RepID=A0AAE0HX88_9PEZI|nr:hypothetical protein B0H66DRAFT_627109 [Apodospora peruviana]
MPRRQDDGESTRGRGWSDGLEVPLASLTFPQTSSSKIFGYFKPGVVTLTQGNSVFRVFSIYLKRYDDPIRHQTIENARLVCRLFCEIASRHLFPVVQVHLNQPSLDRLDAISRNPHIAVGIQGVELILDYCPKELAQDLGRFRAHCLKGLGDHEETCSWYLEGILLGHEAQQEQEGRVASFKDPIIIDSEYHQGELNYGSISDAWDRVGQSAAKVSVLADEATEYQRILLRVYDELGRKHEEQARLIADGTFATWLRRPCCVYDLLYPCASSASSIDFDGKAAVRVLNTKDGLFQFAITPLKWEEIELLEGGAELLPARLLSTLPTAMHRAGRDLRHSQICCFPLRSNHSALCPSDVPTDSAWDGLVAAFQQLASFWFGHHGSLSVRGLRPEHLPADQQAFIDRYLSAVLSGHRLEAIDLDFHSFALHDGEKRDGLYYRVDAALGTPDWPRIKILSIAKISLHQAALDKLCAGVGNGLEHMRMRDVDMLSGEWAAALDMLRNRMVGRCRDGRCRFILSGAFGANLERRISKI